MQESPFHCDFSSIVYNLTKEPKLLEKRNRRRMGSSEVPKEEGKNHPKCRCATKRLPDPLGASLFQESIRRVPVLTSWAVIWSIIVCIWSIWVPIWSILFGALFLQICSSSFNLVNAVWQGKLVVTQANISFYWFSLLFSNPCSWVYEHMVQSISYFSLCIIL